VTLIAPLARWTAIAIAAAAVLDPRLSLPRLERPAIRVLPSGDGERAAALSNALRGAGFNVDAAQGEVATVIVGDHVDPGVSEDAPYGGGASKDAPYNGVGRVFRPAVWALDTSPGAPNVTIARVSVSDVRLPEQAIDLRVSVNANGMSGKTTEIVVEDSGIPVASAKHTWTDAVERWTPALQYLPPGAPGGRLRVRAIPVESETSAGDNVADVAFPAMRGPVRTLVVEAGVTWPALFTRRALEGEPAFAVSAVQRASKNIATRAGSPPGALTRATLAPYEVAVVGGLDSLGAPDLEALRWFVEERGGVAVFVPDQRPSGRYGDLAGLPAFESRVLEEPLRLRGAAGDVLASELLVPRSMLHAARVLAATDSAEPVVFTVRRGAGAVIFSGALDAWRFRGRDHDAFARFWRRAIAGEAAAVSPALDVTVSPALARLGEAVRVTARLRSSEIPPATDRVTLPSIAAHAVSPSAHVDEGIRLWPTAEPGVYEGTWRAPAAGDYNVSVALGSWRGDAAIAIGDAVTHGSTSDPESLALLARGSGGQVFAADRSSDLVDALRSAYPARRVTRPTHPMRSSWWVVPFSLLLSAEWLLRRKARMA